MHFLTTALLAATLTTTCLAKPLPLMNMDEIQQRWFNGETEASIHQSATHRDATPAWPILRKDVTPEEFITYAPDERTMNAAAAAKRSTTTILPGRPATPELLRKMKAFVRNWRSQEGEEEVVAPVLKPKRGMIYHRV